MNSRSDPSKKLWGIFTRKERWSLSWRGWLLVTSVVVFTTYQLVVNVQPFLAVTHRVNANILVVEGWVHPYAIRAAMEEFRSHSYERVFTTGGPVVGKGGYINDYQTSASVGADLLKEEGLPAEVVQMVPSHVSGRDRTYSSAIALREWFREHNIQVSSLNIVTEGAHARRTRLLFEEALGRDVKVGVIAVPSPDFDARRWWYYSEGLEEVVQEGLGYLYAKFFFYPGESDSVTQIGPIGARHLSPEPAPAN